MNKEKVIGKVGKYNISFREEKLSSHGGLVLINEFEEKLGIKKIIDREMKVKRRARGYIESESILGLVNNMIIGGECLSDLNILRGDKATQQLLGVKSVIAPTTAGEYLRKHDIGDIRDLQRVNAQIQQQVRPQQQGSICTIDLDSSVYEQASYKKEGSRKAYNGQIGYHPLFAFWAEEGELIFSHLRRGNAYTAHKSIWFLTETLKRLPKQNQKQLRADSGFYSYEIVAYCQLQEIMFAITADQTQALMNVVYDIDELQWQDIEKYGVAQVAALSYQPIGWDKPYRYVVKRELVQNKKGELSFRFHLVVTHNSQMSELDLMIWHLQHANMENQIKEHKSGFALEKLPSQRFHANWAYLLIGQLAFNLLAWFKKLILPPDYHHKTIKTIRHHILYLAGKIVRSARQNFLVFSDSYLFQHLWLHAIDKLALISFS